LLPYNLQGAFASIGFASKTQHLCLAEMNNHDNKGTLMKGKQDDLMINNNLYRRHIGSLIQHILMLCPFSIVIMLMTIA
jgi:hypothetical protein